MIWVTMIWDVSTELSWFQKVSREEKNMLEKKIRSIFCVLPIYTILLTKKRHLLNKKKKRKG